MSTQSGWHRKTANTAAQQQRKRQYNSREYKAAKARGRRAVEAGTASCWRCHTPLLPGQPWHLGHDDHDRTIIRGPECVTCNLHAAAVKGNHIRAGTTPVAPTRATRTW